MNLVDVNVLIYAVNEADPKHERTRAWLDTALNGQESVGFPWLSLLGFLRLATKVGLFPAPLPVDSALDRIRAWTGQPSAVIVHPTARHLDVLAGLLAEAGAGGNLVSDAHLAALAIEHNATLVTYDRDFGRFPGLRSRPPA